MEVKYSKGKRGELDAIVTEACKVFDVDFPNLLPKIYAKGCETEEFHHLIKEDGNIIALVLNYPDYVYVGGKKLKVYGIGTVSVDGERRGKGYMIELMNKSLEEMRNEGGDISILGGQKQRYEYFGYSYTGDELHFHINRTNMRHHFGSDFAEIAAKYTFRDVEAGSEDEKRCIELMKTKPIWCEMREKDFLCISATWYKHITGVYSGGEFCGYFISGDDHHDINELVLCDESDILEFVRSVFVGLGVGELNFNLPVYMAEAIRPLYTLANHFGISPEMNLNVINYKNTIEAFAALKCSFSDIPDGCFTLEVVKTEGSEKYTVSVCGGEVRVEDVTGSGIKAELSLPHLRMQEFLFSSAATAYLPHLSPFAKALFPLPFWFAGADKV